MTPSRQTNSLRQGLLTLLGLVAGGGVGFAVASFPAVAEVSAAICSAVGRIWLAALQMTVLPLVVAVLITGIADVANAAHTGKLAKQTLAWIGGLSLAASVLAVLVARSALAMLPRSFDVAAVMTAAGSEQPLLGSETDWAKLIPNNIVAAAASNAVVPVVIFTLLFAAALTKLEPHRRSPVLELSHSVAAAMGVAIEWILAFAPIGVFALFLPLTVAGGGRMLGPLSGYVAILMSVYFAITVAVYGLVWVSGCGLYRFLRAALPAQGVAAGTQSSVASLPAMFQAADTMGFPSQISGVVLPLTVSLFRITSPAQYLVVAEFIAWSHGVELSWQTVTLLVPLSAVISLSSVGLPGQASFMGTTLPVVQAAGLPIAPLGLLLAVDVVPDIAATVGNVTADLALTARTAAVVEKMNA